MNIRMLEDRLYRVHNNTYYSKDPEINNYVNSCPGKCSIVDDDLVICIIPYNVAKDLETKDIPKGPIPISVFVSDSLTPEMVENKIIKMKESNFQSIISGFLHGIVNLDPSEPKLSNSEIDILYKKGFNPIKFISYNRFQYIIWGGMIIHSSLNTIENYFKYKYIHDELINSIFQLTGSYLNFHCLKNTLNSKIYNLAAMGILEIYNTTVHPITKTFEFTISIDYIKIKYTLDGIDLFGGILIE